MYLKLSCYRWGSNSFGEHLFNSYDILGLKFITRNAFRTMKTVILRCVFHVAFVSSILKVVQSWISAVMVQMIHFHSFWIGSNECNSHHAVDASYFPTDSISQTDAGIAFNKLASKDAWRRTSNTFETLNAPELGNLIQSFVTLNIAPFFGSKFLGSQQRVGFGTSSPYFDCQSLLLLGATTKNAIGDQHSPDIFKESRSWFDFQTSRALLFCYTFSSHCGNLLSRFALWSGSFAADYSGRAVLIIARG